MSDILFYKLPSIDLLYLHARNDLTASTDPDVWRRALLAKAVVTFTRCDMTLRFDSNCYDILCFIDVQSQHNVGMLSFSAKFVSKTLHVLPTSDIHQSEAADQMFGARFTNRTKIVSVEQSVQASASIIFGNWSYSFVNARMDSRGTVSASHEQQLCDALPKEVVAAVSGVVCSVFTCTESDGKSGIGTLLLGGASGSGSKTLMQRLTRQNNAHLLRISAASFYAGAKGGGSVTKEWAQKQVRDVVLCALSLRRCVLLFEDLHFLTPATSRDVKLTEAEEGTVEV